MRHLLGFMWICGNEAILSATMLWLYANEDHRPLWLCGATI